MKVEDDAPLNLEAARGHFRRSSKSLSGARPQLEVIVILLLLCFLEVEVA